MLTPSALYAMRDFECICTRTQFLAMFGPVTFAKYWDRFTSPLCNKSILALSTYLNKSDLEKLTNYINLFIDDYTNHPKL